MSLFLNDLFVTLFCKEARYLVGKNLQAGSEECYHEVIITVIQVDSIEFMYYILRLMHFVRLLRINCA